MSCQARILDAECFDFHTTKECGRLAKKRIATDDSTNTCCDECLRRYNTKKDWYGWFDGDYPPSNLGSKAFSQAFPQGFPKKSKVPQKPEGSCATCWRSSFTRTVCQKCSVELCRACSSVPPKGYTGDFCKRCVPKVVPVPEAVVVPEAVPVAVPVVVPVAEQELVTAFETMTIAQQKPKPNAKPTLDYPIRDDIASLSLEELRDIRQKLVVWMKEYQNKYPRLLVPYYRYRIKMDALILQKK